MDDAKKMPKYLHLNGKVVPYEDAKIHILSPCVKYGAGVFEGIRGYWNDQQEEMYVFRLAEHLDRLQYSMKVMRYDEVFSNEQMADWTLELIRANNFRETVHIRLMTYVDGAGEQNATGPIGIAISALARPIPKKLSEGVSAGVSSWVRLADNAMPVRVKCNANYQNGRLASIEAKLNKYDASLMLNARGTVAEGPGMCFFAIRNGRPITPPVTGSILESITRDTLIRLMGEYMNLETEEREIDRSELYACEEAFYCGTGWEITPVTSIDRAPVGDGKVGAITKKLQELYFKLAKGEIGDHAAWRTPVYKRPNARAA